MEDSQKTWIEYYEQIKNRRLDEAAQVWAIMLGDSIEENTVYAMDFSHFSNKTGGIQKLAEQLAEDYEVEVTGPNEDGYEFLKGTTRPYGHELSKEDLLEWVEFMCDVSRSYSCVFSTWTLESTELEACWSNKDVESSKNS